MSKKIERWKEEFIKKYSANGVVVLDREALGHEEFIKQIDQASAPSLFASKKLVICKEGLPTKAGQEDLADFIEKLTLGNDSQSFYVFYSLKNLDKRIGSIKRILKLNVNLVEFTLPHGSSLNAWLKAYAQQMNFNMDNAAIEKLAVYLGRDLFEEKKFGGRVVERKEVFDLWQAYSELLKLSNYGKNITAPDVESLVTPKVSENIFELSDTLIRKQRGRAVQILENLFADQSSDEKAVAIKITALLAEQVRALLAVQILKQKNYDNDTIAEMLGWSSGRVFMVSKQAGELQLDTLKAMLANLLKIDLNLKTGNHNPKLMVDLFAVKFS